MRWLALVLLALIVALQYPMWLGKGGWLQVRAYDREVAQEQEANAKLAARNAALDADVRDLKTGFEAIEERARAELGMIRQDEVFFQLQQGAAPAGAARTTERAPRRDRGATTGAAPTACSGSRAGTTPGCASSRD